VESCRAIVKMPQMYVLDDQMVNELPTFSMLILSSFSDLRSEHNFNRNWKSDPDFFMMPFKFPNVLSYHTELFTRMVRVSRFHYWFLCQSTQAEQIVELGDESYDDLLH
jgi:hypothetical protein